MKIDPDSYNEAGFAYPVTMMSGSEAAEYRAVVEALAEKYGGARAQELSGKPHLLSPDLAPLVRAESVLDAVETVLGPNILCWAADFFIKQPGDESFVAWHQDATYWHIEPLEALTVWIALTDVRKSNGPLAFLRGSHRGARPRYVRKEDSRNMLTSGQTIDTSDLGPVEEALLDAGQASLHHALTVHGSGANTGPGPRIGFAIRYISARAKPFQPESAPPMVRGSATLVRGTDEYGYYDKEPDPRDISPEEAESVRKDALARQMHNEYGAVDSRWLMTDS